MFARTTLNLHRVHCNREKKKGAESGALLRKGGHPEHESPDLLYTPFEENRQGREGSWNGRELDAGGPRIAAMFAVGSDTGSSQKEKGEKKKKKNHDRSWI